MRVTYLRDSIRKRVDASNEKVRQAVICRPAIKEKIPVAVVNIILIHLPVDVLGAKAKVVAAFNPVDVIGPLILISHEFGRSIGSSAYIKVTGCGKIDEIGIGIEHIYTQSRGARHTGWAGAVNRQPRICKVECVDDGSVDGELVTQNDGLRTLQKVGAGCGENVVGVDRRIGIIKDEIAGEDIVSSALHPIHAAYNLVLIAGIGYRVNELPTWIGRYRHQRSQRQ